MAQSLTTLPIRISLRTARAVLRTTRDAADLGLAALELVGQVLGEPDAAHDDAEREWAERSSRGGPVDSERDSLDDRAAERNGAGGPGVSAPPPEPSSVPRPVALPDPPLADEGAIAAEAAEIIADEAEILAEEAELVSDEPDLVYDDDAHISEEAELVEEIAEPGAEDGAGAQIRIEPPFDGYDALRAADVVARLSGVDDAELAETELYESANRGRRTVLDAIAREARRRGPR